MITVVQHVYTFTHSYIVLSVNKYGSRVKILKLDEFVNESLSEGIVEPRVGCRAFRASIEVHIVFIGEETGYVDGAWVGERAEGQALNVTFRLPFLEIVDSSDFRRAQNPADGLLHRDEEIVSAARGAPYPVPKSLQELRSGLKVGGGEVESQGSSVRREMVLQVVVQEPDKLFLFHDVGTLIDVVTTGELFIKKNVITPIQFVQGDFPDPERLGGTFLVGSEALVGHAEIEGIGPDGHTAPRGTQRRVVEESPFDHHLELLVATHTSIGYAHAKNIIRSDVSKFFNDNSCTVELGVVPISAHVGPIEWFLLVCDRVNGDFVSSAVKFLHARVVSEGV